MRNWAILRLGGWSVRRSMLPMMGTAASAPFRILSSTIVDATGACPLELVVIMKPGPCSSGAVDYSTGVEHSQNCNPGEDEVNKGWQFQR